MLAIMLYYIIGGAEGGGEGMLRVYIISLKEDEEDKEKEEEHEREEEEYIYINIYIVAIQTADIWTFKNS